MDSGVFETTGSKANVMLEEQPKRTICRYVFSGILLFRQLMQTMYGHVPCLRFRLAYELFRVVLRLYFLQQQLDRLIF